MYSWKYRGSSVEINELWVYLVYVNEFHYVVIVFNSYTFSGNRKALVEKSGLVKHATNRKQKESQKTSPVDPKANSNR